MPTREMLAAALLGPGREEEPNCSKLRPALGAPRPRIAANRLQTGGSMSMLRRLVLIGSVATPAATGAPAAFAVSGAGYTTVNAATDGSNHCKNGNPAVNCNIYDGKQYVWLNGRPAANGLGPDGSYFFAVLVPGGQPNPNDGGAKNLSDDFHADKNHTIITATRHVTH